VRGRFGGFLRFSSFVVRSIGVRKCSSGSYYIRKIRPNTTRVLRTFSSIITPLVGPA
jgi:hypothetical protein